MLNGVYMIINLNRIENGHMHTEEQMILIGNITC
jgi:hypothetical protein